MPRESPEAGTREPLSYAPVPADNSSRIVPAVAALLPMAVMSAAIAIAVMLRLDYDVVGPPLLIVALLGGPIVAYLTTSFFKERPKSWLVRSVIAINCVWGALGLIGVTIFIMAILFED